MVVLLLSSELGVAARLEHHHLSVFVTFPTGLRSDTKRGVTRVNGDQRQVVQR